MAAVEVSGTVVNQGKVRRLGFGVKKMERAIPLSCYSFGKGAAEDQEAISTPCCCWWESVQSDFMA